MSAATVEKRSLLPRVGLVLAILAVGAAGYVAVARALTEPAGPTSPEEAATRFFEALENEDVLGMTDVLLPSERTSLIEPSLAIFEELERLDVFDGDVDLDQMDGIDIEIEGLELTSTPITPGLVVIETTGGTVTTSIDDGISLGGLEIGADAGTDTHLVADNPVRLATVEEDGGWYVSLYYSTAEEIRRDLGGRAPVLGGGPVPVGAPTPEQALERLLDRAVELDATGVLTSIDPQEARALYDYSYLFLDDADELAQTAREEAARSGATWSLDRVDVSASDNDGRTVVTVDGFLFTAATESDSLSLELADGCFTWVISDVDSDRFCEGELLEADHPLYGVELPKWDSGVTVVQRDGAWFVSVVPTVLYTYRDFLASLDSGEIESMIDAYDDLVLGLGGDVGSLVLGTGEPDGDFDAVSGSVEGADGMEFDDRDGFEDDYTEFAPDQAVVPEGAYAYGSDPDFWILAFEVDPFPGMVLTSLSDSHGGWVEVATLADGSTEAPLVIEALLNEGWLEIDTDGLPAGARRFSYDEWEEAVVYRDHVMAYWVNDERPVLAEAVMQILGR